MILHFAIEISNQNVKILTEILVRKRHRFFLTPFAKNNHAITVVETDKILYEPVLSRSDPILRKTVDAALKIYKT